MKLYQFSQPDHCIKQPVSDASRMWKFKFQCEGVNPHDSAGSKTQLPAMPVAAVEMFNQLQVATVVNPKESSASHFTIYTVLETCPVARFSQLINGKHSVEQGRISVVILGLRI
jgi:hypothetical protein